MTIEMIELGADEVLVYVHRESDPEEYEMSDLSRSPEIVSGCV